MKATFISRFTPSLMAPKALEAVFVQRHALADQMVQLARDAALTPSKSHMLLIGPRGIGKTHLMALLYHRLQAMEDLRERLLIAWLREEEWGVTSFLDLLLRIFRALQAEYRDVALEERVEALFALPPDEAERSAAALLKEFSIGRTLLILAENLDDMFDVMGEEGQQRLRAYLQEHPFCSIIATAQGLFNGISLQTSPFYGFFRIRHLEGVDFEEAVRMLANIAAYEGDQELAPFIQTPQGRARIRAVHHLAGGSFRVYVIFSQFLTRQSLDELIEPFMHTLDDLTPYYQARMAWLSPQQRKIVEFLCDRRHAVTVKEIAQRCFISHQTASSQLKDLREKGYVHAITVGRESHYELHEPLMRFCIEVKKQRGEPIRLFVDFLRLWYSRPELEQRLAALAPDAVLEREYVLRTLRAAEEDPTDPRIAACLKDYKGYYERKDFKRALEVAEELVAMHSDPSDWFDVGHCLSNLERYDEALVSYNKVIELDPNDAWAWALRGCTLHDLTHYDEALVSYNKAIKLGSQLPYLFFLRAEALLALNHWEEGLAALDDALQRLMQDNALESTNTTAIISHLFGGAQDTAVWRTRIEMLVGAYDKHQALSILGQGLVHSIRALSSPVVSDPTAKAWRDVWHDLIGMHQEFTLPLRLVDAAVRYRETLDVRVLLELPIEERHLLESLLGLEESA